MNLGYFPDSRGRIVTEMSILRHDEEHFTLITAAAAQWHDYELLERALPPESDIRITDCTEDYSTLIVCGPRSRKLFEGLAPRADLARPWLSHFPACVAGRPSALARVSYAGELGWEIHSANANLPEIYEAVLDAGATPFGMWALNSLRIEKGYRAWKGDLSTDYTLLEGGLERFIRFGKPSDFPGRTELLKEKQQGSRKTFATLIVEAGECDAPYMSTVWKNGKSRRRNDFGCLGLSRGCLHSSSHGTARMCSAWNDIGGGDLW